MTCPNCSFDLCLTCCHEIRNGCLKAGLEEAKVIYIYRGLEYYHGEDGKPVDKDGVPTNEDGEPVNVSPTTTNDTQSVESQNVWKASEDGRIPCPPKSIGGCGKGFLELERILEENFISYLVKKAEEIVKICQLEDSVHTLKQCSCLDLLGKGKSGKDILRKVASRSDSNDNYLYCPRARDVKPGDLFHFRFHWMRGEPVIVSNVLDMTSGLSWDPMVMWRALRQISHKKHGEHKEVKAIDCLDCCEVSIISLGFCIFFTSYLSYGKFSSGPGYEKILLAVTITDNDRLVLNNLSCQQENYHLSRKIMLLIMMVFAVNMSSLIKCRERSIYTSSLQDILMAGLIQKVGLRY